MTTRLSPDPGTSKAWRAFWQMAEGRLTNDPVKSSTAMATLAPIATGNPTYVLVVAVDAVVDTLTEWADQLGKNPACMAEASFTMLHAQLTPPERLILLAASETLLALDPTGEAGTPHDVCHPWPAQTPVVSLATAAGGSVLQQALTAAPQTNGLEEHPALTLCNVAPNVLTQILWGRSGSNPERMGQLLSAKQAL